MDIEICKNCGKKYGYISTGNPWPGGKEREYAICPYCKAEGHSEMISGFIHSFKVDDQGRPLE